MSDGSEALPGAEKDAASVEDWADAWDVRPLIEARIRAAKAEALREAAHATLAMTYPTSADPDVWGAWLLERAEAYDPRLLPPGGGRA